MTWRVKTKTYTPNGLYIFSKSIKMALMMPNKLFSLKWAKATLKTSKITKLLKITNENCLDDYDLLCYFLIHCDFNAV